MKRQKTAFEWFMGNVANMLGGVFIGLSIPIGVHILPGSYDLLFLPVGIILMGLSFYYKFIKDYEK